MKTVSRDEAVKTLHQLLITTSLLRCVQTRHQNGVNTYGGDVDLGLDVVIERLDAAHAELDEFFLALSAESEENDEPHPTRSTVGRVRGQELSAEREESGEPHSVGPDHPHDRAVQAMNAE